MLAWKGKLSLHYVLLFIQYLLPEVLSCLSEFSSLPKRKFRKVGSKLGEE